MALTYPAGVFSGHDPYGFAPYLPVIAEDAAEPGRHVRPLVPWVNHALAAGHCQTVVSASWADGQAVHDTVGLETVLYAPLPPAPSDLHTRLRVTLRVRGDDEEVLLGLANVGGGFVPIIVPAGAGPHTLEDDVTVAAVDGELGVAGAGRVEVLSVEARWLPLVSEGGLWPGETDILEPDPISGIYPLDDDDYDVDEPLDAADLSHLFRALSHCRERQLGVISIPSFGTAPLARRPIRGLLRVPAGGTTLTIWLDVAGDEEAETAGYVWIQHGRGGTGMVTSGDRQPWNTRELVLQDTGRELRFIELHVDDRLRGVVDDTYPGGAWVAFFAERCHLYGAGAWAR